MKRVLKKRLALVLAASLLQVNLAFSQTTTHIVDRGETLKSIAEKYGLTEDELKKSNPLVSDKVYTGMSLTIVNIHTNSRSNANDLTQNSKANTAKASNRSYDGYSKLISDANFVLGEGRSKESIKLYSKAIKEYSYARNCVEAYHGRAIAYYNTHKWKKAIEDFETALYFSEKGTNRYEQCEALLANAEKYRNEQLENRKSLWGGIFAATALTAAGAYVASQSANMPAPDYYVPTPSFNTPNVNYDYADVAPILGLGEVKQFSIASQAIISQNTPSFLFQPIDMEELAISAIQEVGRQRDAFLAQYRQDYKNTYGKEPTKKEEDEAYLNWQRIQIEATNIAMQEKNRQNSNSYSGSSSTTTQNSTGSTSTKSSSRVTCSHTSQYDKLHCGGTGICDNCNGSGLMDAFGLRNAVCTYCGGTGKCKTCKGTGYLN